MPRLLLALFAALTIGTATLAQPVNGITYPETRRVDVVET